MKHNLHFLTAVCAAVMLSASLTGCGGSGSSNTLTTEPVTAEITASQTVSSETQQTAAQTTESETAPTTDASLTAATEQTASSASTAPKARRDDWLDSIGTLAEGGYVAQLRCTGTVNPNNVNFRDKAGKNGKQLKQFKKGTALEITGITANGSVTDSANRWLRVKANGQEGYVNAEYVNAECKIPLSQLSGEEIGALCILLYYQTERLDMIFRREGGLSAQEVTDELDQEGYARVKPDGLTIEKLRSDYRRWFCSDYKDDFDQLYREKDNALWVMTGYGDNVALEYTIPEQLTGKTDDTLTYQIRAQWYPEFDMTMDGSNTNNHTFTICYTDGVWKVKEYDPV